jgi:hypothetical protein
MGMHVMRGVLCVVLACVCWEAILQGVMFPSASLLSTEDAGSMRVGWWGIRGVEEVRSISSARAAVANRYKPNHLGITAIRFCWSTLSPLQFQSTCTVSIVGQPAVK